MSFLLIKVITILETANYLTVQISEQLDNDTMGSQLWKKVQTHTKALKNENKTLEL